MGGGVIGGVDVLSFFFLAEDRTTAGFTSAIANTNRLEAAGERLRVATRRGAQEMSQFGMGLTAIGGLLMLTSEKFGDFGGIVFGAGTALAAVGSGISTVVPMLRVMRVVLFGELLPAVYEYVAALWAAYAAEIIVTGGIALVVGAVAAWFLLSQSQKKETDAVKDQVEAYADLNVKMKDSVELKKDLRGLSEDLAGAELDVREALLDQKDAQKDLGEAEIGTDEYERAFIRLQRVNQRVVNAKENVKTLGDAVETTGETLRTTTWQEEVQARLAAEGPVMMSMEPGHVGEITGGGPMGAGLATQTTKGIEGARSVTFQIQNVNLSPSDTLQAWMERENQTQQGVPNLP